MNKDGEIGRSDMKHSDVSGLTNISYTQIMQPNHDKSNYGVKYYFYFYIE